MRFKILLWILAMSLIKNSYANEQSRMYQGDYTDYLDFEACVYKGVLEEEILLGISYKNNSQYNIDFLPDEVGLSKDSHTLLDLFVKNEHGKKNLINRKKLDSHDTYPINRVKSRFILAPDEVIQYAIPLHKLFYLESLSSFELEYSFAFGVKEKEISWSGTILSYISKLEKEANICSLELKQIVGIYSEGYKAPF